MPESRRNRSTQGLLYLVSIALTLAFTSQAATADEVIFRDMPHCAQGVATLNLVGTPESGMLAIGNIGSSGEDGVAVELPNACGWFARWQPLPLPNDGDLFRVRVWGELNEVPDELLGTVWFEDTGPELELAVDLPPGQFLLNQMRVFDGFSIAYHGVIDDEGQAATVGSWPDEVRLESICTDIIFSSITFYWDSSTTVSIPGGPTVNAQIIEIVSGGFTSLFTEVDVEVAGIAAVTLVDAGFSRRGTPVEDAVPSPLALEASVPNPFNPRTEIRYSLPRLAKAELTVHDVRGRLVRTLLEERKSAGSHSVMWDGTDDAGRSVVSGTYLIRMQSDGDVRHQKVTLIR